MCRGIGILFVILGHCDPPFNKIIYGFHMPLFAILTGYLFSIKNDVRKIHTGFLQKYIVPYFVLCFINLIVMYIYYLFLNDEFNVWHYIKGILYSRGTTEWMPNCSPLWYLTALFVSISIFDRLHRSIDKEYVVMIIILLLAFIGFTLDKINFYKLPWNIDTALVLLLFLEVGYLFKSSIQYDVKALAYVMVLMIGILIICINTNVDFDGNEYGNIILMLLGALFVDMSILGISKKIYECKILQFYGKHTLFIMGFDYLSGHISDIILNKINFDNWFSLFILKLVILTIGVVIWNFIVSLIPNNKIKKLLKY